MPRLDRASSRGCCGDDRVHLGHDRAAQGRHPQPRGPRCQRRRLGCGPPPAADRSLAGLPAPVPRGRAGHHHPFGSMGCTDGGHATLRCWHRRRTAGRGVSHLSLVSTSSDQSSKRGADGTLRAVSGPSCWAADLSPSTSCSALRAEGLPILTTYGMTETGPGVAVGGADAATLADPTALRPLPGVDMRIAAPDRAGVGRIEVRGAMVFSGYVGHPRAAADRSQDGWWRTGIWVASTTTGSCASSTAGRPRSCRR